MEKSIRVHYKDGMITRYEYSTETFLKIAESMGIIHYTEIEDRALFDSSINNPNQERVTMTKPTTEQVKLSERQIREAIRMTFLFSEAARKINESKEGTSDVENN